MTNFNYNKKRIVYDSNYHLLKFGRLFKERQFYICKAKISKKSYFSNLFSENSKVFEFGCGLGQNLLLINDKSGYDINKQLYPFLKKQNIKTVGSLNDIPNNFFDEILLCQVLEHLEDPVKIINQLKSKLKKGGKIRIVLPKVNYKIERNINRSIDGHLFGWGFYEINYLLNSCGFENILNKKVYRRGIDILYPLSKINFNFYFYLTKLLGYILNDFDILIISKKK